MTEQSPPSRPTGRLWERPLFVYGTLRDSDLRRILIGRETVARPAAAPGFSVRAEDPSTPIILPNVGESAIGALIEDLTREELLRLSAYEGADYALSPVAVTMVSGQLSEAREAAMFAPTRPPAADAPASWSLADFAHDRSTVLAAAERLAPLLGDLSPESVDAIWPDLIGAARRDQGRRPLLTTQFSADADMEVLERTRPYDAYFAVDELSVRHKTFLGAWTEPLGRAVFITGPAVIVLPYDPIQDRVLLIEQFRAGPAAAGDPRPWGLEAVAGRFGPGESAEEVARREAEEEAGLELGRVEIMGRYYASPGCLDEEQTFIVAEARLGAEGEAGLHGLDDENEDIRALIAPFETAMAAMAAGEVRNTPLALCLLWLARNRARLQALWRD